MKKIFLIGFNILTDGKINENYEKLNDFYS